MKAVLTKERGWNPKRGYKPKKHFYIIRHGHCIGETYAVSQEKAVTNWWWNNIKHHDEMTPTDVRPEDLDAVEDNKP